MKDYAAVLIGTALFAFMSPGLLLQLPGKHKPVDFLNMKTSIVSILLHTVIFGLLLILFLIVLNVHIYAQAFNYFNYHSTSSSFLYWIIFISLIREFEIYCFSIVSWMVIVIGLFIYFYWANASCQIKCQYIKLLIISRKFSSHLLSPTPKFSKPSYIYQNSLPQRIELDMWFLFVKQLNFKQDHQSSVNRVIIRLSLYNSDLSLQKMNK